MRPSINLAKNIKQSDHVFALMNCEVIKGMTFEFFIWIFKQLLPQYFFLKIYCVKINVSKMDQKFLFNFQSANQMD